MGGMETLELAKAKELDICYEIIDMGRSYQREQGFVQWTKDYPNRDTIKGDIATGKGYVLKLEDGVIAGYMCIDFDGEPAYDDIEGQWSAELPYAVVHRMAFHKGLRGQGLSQKAFRLIEKLCLSKGVSYIRIDTDPENALMQHILEKNGFKRCGIIVFQGSGKLAYDKIISDNFSRAAL